MPNIYEVIPLKSTLNALPPTSASNAFKGWVMLAEHMTSCIFKTGDLPTDSFMYISFADASKVLLWQTSLRILLSPRVQEYKSTIVTTESREGEAAAMWQAGFRYVPSARLNVQGSSSSNHSTYLMSFSNPWVSIVSTSSITTCCTLLKARWPLEYHQTIPEQ